MQLSDGDILWEARGVGLRVDPPLSWVNGQVQPASIELTLDWEDDGEPKYLMKLYPGEFRLAHTRETVTLGPHLAAQLTGKSSYGRLGLTVHSTAG